MIQSANDALMLTPDGVTDISRWLSEATPPVPIRFKNSPSTPPGVWDIGGLTPLQGAGKTTASIITGGIASLNHRLMAAIPPGSRGRSLNA